MLANALKVTAAAAVMGLGAMAVTAPPASADTYKTRCSADDCVRLQCDDWGRACFRVDRFDRGDYDRPVPYGYMEAYHAYPDSYRAYPDTYYAPDYDYDYNYAPDYDYDYDYPG